jgi:hypothetical protein
MSGHCPQDGGFIGDAGCTHPNHQHSELVKGLLSAKEPKTISTKDAEAALKEGFYVKNPEGKQVGFGEQLLTHIGSHLKGDADARKTRLMFAVKTVTEPDVVDKNHKGLENRTLYTKAFDKFGILAVSEPGKDSIEQVFTIVPNRKGKKRKG